MEHAVSRFQAGDREAGFRLLYERFFRPLLRFYARKGCSPEERLDLTQDTFLRIYDGLDDFRGDARFETWLYRIAATTHLKHLRAEATAKRQGREVSPDELPEGVAPLRSAPAQLDGLIGEQRRQRLRSAIRTLPDRMRRCVMLRVYHEMSYREIGKVLRIEAATVKAHLFQARQKLRESLPETAFGELAPEGDAGKEGTHDA